MFKKIIGDVSEVIIDNFKTYDLNFDDRMNVFLNIITSFMITVLDTYFPTDIELFNSFMNEFQKKLHDSLHRAKLSYLGMGDDNTILLKKSANDKKSKFEVFKHEIH